MSRVFLTGLRGGGTGLGHMALLSMVCEEYLALCVSFIYDKLCLGTPGEQGCFLNKLQVPGRDSAPCR